jgi:hypothetical protein
LASITGGHCLCPSDRQGKAVNMRRGSAGYGPLWFDKFWRSCLGLERCGRYVPVRWVLAVSDRLGLASCGSVRYGGLGSAWRVWFGSGCSW